MSRDDCLWSVNVKRKYTEQIGKKKTKESKWGVWELQKEEKKTQKNVKIDKIINDFRSQMAAIFV
jgi:hypothetical protein